MRTATLESTKYKRDCRRSQARNPVTKRVQRVQKQCPIGWQIDEQLKTNTSRVIARAKNLQILFINQKNCG